MQKKVVRRVATLVALGVALGIVLSGCSWFGPRDAALDPMGANPKVRLEVVVHGGLTDDVLAELESYGKILDVIDPIGVLLEVRSSQVAGISALSYVKASGGPAERFTTIDDYSAGLSTWDLDIINVTDPAAPEIRTVDYTGEGVLVAVLDTGLVFNWRDYFPEARIATEYAIAFAGGGNENATVSEPSNKWEHDTHSHGTHVTSTVIGYALGGTPVNGAAPLARVIPVKVLGNSGSGWSTVIARGIAYIGDLAEELGEPIVINMSLGGPSLSALEQAAIDRAIEQGVIVVASAGNEGLAGMGYPGAYSPVISVGAVGWSGFAWTPFADVGEPTAAGEVVLCDFSSVALAGQDLDVVAPGDWIVGPYMPFGAAHPPAMPPSPMANVPGEYYFVGGTSMAAPHVAGVVALLLEKHPNLTAEQVEIMLEGTALALPGYSDDEVGAGLALADAALLAPVPVVP